MYQKPANDLTQEGAPAQVPPSATRSIFRSEAREHYIQNQEKVELPRLISAKHFLYLWIVALLLMAAGLVVAFWPLLQQLR